VTLAKWTASGSKPNFFKFNDFGMEKINTGKNRLDLWDLKLGKNIQMLRFYDALCNLICTKSKFFYLNCCACIIMVLSFVSKGNSGFSMPKNQYLAFGLCILLNGVTLFP